MEDARNIALSLEASEAADYVKDRFVFGQKVDVVRLGIAYAIRHGVSVDRDASWGRLEGTNYNVATVDDTAGTFRDLVTIFYDEPSVIARPYATIETLMNKGLLLLKRHIDEGEIGRLGDLVTASEEEGP